MNNIIWEKPVTNLIDSFFIYRETTANIYTKIGAVPYDSLSEYHDTTANPNTTSYRYKLSALDTCGAESDLSPHHNTIHLQNLGTGNFQWTFYQIEPGANPVISFNVYRDNNNTGNFLPIGFVPGTNATFTDVNYFSFPNSVYMVDVNWGISCSPTRAINTTRSNKRHVAAIDYLTISAEQADRLFDIFPNPATETITVKLPENARNIPLALSNILGQTVWRQTVDGGSQTIAVNNFPKGIYTLSAGDLNKKVFKKLIIQ